MAEDSGSADAALGGRQPSLAERLNRLFDVRKNPATGNRYTNAEVSRAIAEAAAGRPDGITVAASTIGSIRSGVKPNPTKHTIEALARHFKVKPEYFFPDFDAEEVEKVPAAFELIEAVKDSEVRGIALRAHGLSPDSLKMIASVITQARRLEGLDTPDK
ncbi:transcriptional regulator [Streptomyces sp. NBC_00825]|uniref:transcriptional regulator n=1 Tax=unclassified Streptomyces TaxID=2593676 RepID=UPI002ED419A5|nr:transcriptional regulator [Streptomyces sp. NBC_00826]WTH89205.1 transcriptional regulator [Streptomyces sp. NBC_00825]WTH97930.1 transcriptional regulator [Streptomyces sp. NBC_00822]